MGPAGLTVFVYGTLMPGGPRWPYLAPFAESWEPASARGRLWDTGHGFPAATFDAGGDPIPGVAVRLRSETAGDAIRQLDVVEAEGSLYRRVEISTSAGPATSYEWLRPVDGLRALPDGWPQR